MERVGVKAGKGSVLKGVRGLVPKEGEVLCEMGERVGVKGGRGLV
jgi:hypothetical protein